MQVKTIPLGFFLDDQVVLDFCWVSGSEYDVPCRIKLGARRFLEIAISPEPDSCWVNYYNDNTQEYRFHEMVSLETTTQKNGWVFQFDAEAYLKNSGVAEIQSEWNELHFKALKNALEEGTMPFYYCGETGICFGYVPWLYRTRRLEDIGRTYRGEYPVILKFLRGGFSVGGKKIKELSWNTYHKAASLENPELVSYLCRLLHINHDEHSLTAVDMMDDIKKIGADSFSKVDIVTEDGTYYCVENKSVDWLACTKELIIHIWRGEARQTYVIEKNEKSSIQTLLELALHFFTILTPDTTAQGIEQYNSKARMVGYPIIAPKPSR